MLIFGFISSFIYLFIVTPVYLVLCLFRPELFIRLKGCLEFLHTEDFDGKVLMFHGVSVGEIIAIEELIKRAHKEFPDHKIVITTGTNTGQEIAKSKFKDIAHLITYFPPDYPPAIHKFLEKIHPEKIIIAVTEIWPNFSYIVNKKNILLYIINGRISDRSFRSYKHMRFFFKVILGETYTKILTQSEQDREKFIKMGANPDCCEVMGNLKFDIVGTPPDIKFDKHNNRVIIAGSTHSGEEIIIVDKYKKILEKYSDVKLIIAPRHLTRLDEVVQILKKSNLSYGFYSKNDSFENNEVLILDVLGILAKMYYFCDFAFIGGSFAKVGGHNPLEAAIFDKPVISGPNIANFKGIYQVLVTSGAGSVVRNQCELEEEMFKLLEDKEYYENCCKNSHKAFEKNRGAIDLVIEKLKS